MNNRSIKDIKVEMVVFGVSRWVSLTDGGVSVVMVGHTKRMY